MGEASRFLEAVIITAVFATGAIFMNYSAGAGCDRNQSVAAKIERGPSRVVLN